jgi:hypothetical protein
MRAAESVRPRSAPRKLDVCFFKLFVKSYVIKRVNRQRTCPPIGSPCQAIARQAEADQRGEAGFWVAVHCFVGLLEHVDPGLRPCQRCGREPQRPIGPGLAGESSCLLAAGTTPLPVRHEAQPAVRVGGMAPDVENVFIDRVVAFLGVRKKLSSHEYIK